MKLMYYRKEEGGITERRGRRPMKFLHLSNTLGGAGTSLCFLRDEMDSGCNWSTLFSRAEEGGLLYSPLEQ